MIEVSLVNRNLFSRTALLALLLVGASPGLRAGVVLPLTNLTCQRTTFGFTEGCGVANAGGPFGFTDSQTPFGGVDFATANPMPIIDFESSAANPTDTITFTSTGLTSGTTAPAGTDIYMYWNFLLSFIGSDSFGGGTGSIAGTYSVTFDIISNGGSGSSVFGGPVTFSGFTNAAQNSGGGLAVTTLPITTSASYEVLAKVSASFTRTGGTPGLGIQGDFALGAPEPGSIASAGLGLAALAAILYRRARRDH